MADRYRKGEEGWRKRHRNDTRNLYDLIRYFEYGKTSGFKAARVSEEQEWFWADQLKELLEILELKKMKKWEAWELELLETYKRQPTTIGTVAKLLSRSEEEVQQKLEE